MSPISVTSFLGHLTQDGEDNKEMEIQYTVQRRRSKREPSRSRELVGWRIQRGEMHGMNSEREEEEGERGKKKRGEGGAEIEREKGKRNGQNKNLDDLTASLAKHSNDKDHSNQSICKGGETSMDEGVLFYFYFYFFHMVKMPSPPRRAAIWYCSMVTMHPSSSRAYAGSSYPPGQCCESEVQ